MAKQDTFTSDEWALLRLAPSLVASGTAAADPSGLFASIEEAAAGAGVMAMLTDVAEKAAAASTEGGFLGFGGVRVSDKEQTFISDVKKAASIA